MSRWTGLLASLAFGVSSAFSPAEASSPAFSGLFATADDAETAATNPAGMTRLERTTSAVQGMLAKSATEFDVDRGESTFGGGDPDSDHAPIGIPSFY